MGVELGLSAEMLNRHPFPGPGLGVRILGEVTKEKTQHLKRSRPHLYSRINQSRFIR